MTCVNEVFKRKLVFRVKEITLSQHILNNFYNEMQSWIIITSLYNIAKITVAFTYLDLFNVEVSTLLIIMKCTNNAPYMCTVEMLFRILEVALK